jgi:hypothetical protein
MDIDVGDGDGKVTKEEFLAYFAKWHPLKIWSKAKLAKAWRGEDMNKDGFITFDEFTGHKLKEYTENQGKHFNNTEWDNLCRTGNCEACPFTPVEKLDKKLADGSEKYCIHFCRPNIQAQACENPPGPYHLLGGLRSLHSTLTEVRGEGFEEAQHAIGKY